MLQPPHSRENRGEFSDPRRRADLRHHGALDTCPGRRIGRRVLFERIAAERHGSDVFADERVSFRALAEADRAPARRRTPVLTSRALDALSPDAKSHHRRLRPRSNKARCHCGRVRFSSAADPTGKSVRSRQVSSDHNILIFRNRKSVYIAPVSPDERGGSRSSRTCGGMRWTRKWRLTSAIRADGKDVWARHPDAGVKFARSKTSRR